MTAGAEAHVGGPTDEHALPLWVRVLVAVLSLLLMSAAGVWIQRNGPLRPYEPEVTHPRFRAALTEGSYRRSIEVSIDAKRTSVVYRLDIPPGDPILDQAEEGSLAGDPAAVAQLGVGSVSVAADRSVEPLTSAEPPADQIRWDWTAPDLQRDETGSRLAIVASSTGESPNPAAVVVRPPEPCSQPRSAGCAVDVTITAPGYHASSAHPTGVMAGDPETGLSGTVAEPLRVDLGSVPPNTDLLPPEAREWLSSVWRYAWIFAPWVFLLVVVRRRFSRRQGTDALSPATSALQVLLWAAFVSVFSVTQPLVMPEQWRGASAAAPAALVAWAAWAHWQTRLGYGWLGLGLPVLAMVGGLAALLVTAARGPEEPVMLVVGAVLAILGSLALVWGFLPVHPDGAAPPPSPGAGNTYRDGEARRCAKLRPGRRLRVTLAGLGAAGVLICVALTRVDSPSPLDYWVSLVVAYAGAASYLLVLAWVAIHGTDPAAAQWQFTRGVRFAGVVVVGVILLPTSVDTSASEPLPMVTAVSLASASVVLVQLGLISVAIALLWRVARSTDATWQDWTRLGYAVAATFLLRPEVDLLPWSMLAGLGLVVAFLFDRDPDKQRRDAGLCWPCALDDSSPTPVAVAAGTAGQSSAAVPSGPAESILETINAATKAETALRAEQAMRDELTSGDVNLGRPAGLEDGQPDPKEEWDKRLQEWEDHLTSLPARPRPDDVHRAFGYAATPRPTTRARHATAVALAVGIPLSVPFLAETLSDLTDVRGLETWVALVTAFFLLMRFPLYGLYFGFFMPLIRGSTGLAKAARLLVVLVVSEGVALLLPFESVSAFVQAFGLRALQLTLLCAVLGVAADYRSVRAAGRRYPALLDVYGVRSMTFKVSTATLGVLTAAATAAATTSLQSAAEEYVDRLLEPPAVEQLDMGDVPAGDDAEP